MNTIPTNYVTQETFQKEIQKIHNHIDHLLKEIFDYVRVVNDKTENKLENRIENLEIKLGKKIEVSEQRLQTQINSISKKLDANLQELKDINKSILGLDTYHEDRISVLEKKSHIHPADML